LKNRFSPRPIQRTSPTRANQLDAVVEMEFASNAFGNDLLPSNVSPRTTRRCDCAKPTPAPATRRAPSSGRLRPNVFRRARPVVTCGKK
jgi:hypothetical protein